MNSQIAESQNFSLAEQSLEVGRRLFDSWKISENRRVKEKFSAAERPMVIRRYLNSPIENHTQNKNIDGKSPFGPDFARRESDGGNTWRGEF
jgi:hypothetical protein